ncbi:hypothetical protein Avbf_04053 [Armadillidium vulgare]|nr:hypothetical protein Avbf_04053 [Armadillidium vulgare]
MESDICIKYLKIGSPSLFGINFIIIVLNSIFQESYASNVLRPRGVPLSNISSTFVNDGVCDCCDTSDEYASSADCIDNCYLMGEVAREEARRMAEVQYEGYNIRKKMAEEGAKY